MPITYLSLGSNLGDRKAQLETAVRLIEESIGDVVSQSGFVETDPWGYVSSHRFMNACVAVKTDFSVRDCLTALQEIERRMGRLKSAKNGYTDRLIDLDILFFDDLVLQSPDLTVPHPHLQDRLFVLEPLAEIAPNLVHPVLGKTVRALLDALISKT